MTMRSSSSIKTAVNGIGAAGPFGGKTHLQEGAARARIGQNRDRIEVSCGRSSG